jgi:hypothetical protein
MPPDPRLLVVESLGVRLVLVEKSRLPARYRVEAEAGYLAAYGVSPPYTGLHRSFETGLDGKI